MSPRTSEVCWVPLEDPGFEHLRLQAGEGRILADGAILRVLDGKPYRVNYRIAADEAWRFSRAEIAVEGGPRLSLEREESGAWRMNGEPVPEFEDCHEIDFQPTPFTNSLPIGRLAFHGVRPEAIKVVYVPLASLEPRLAEQRYRRLGERRYLYEGLFREFQAELQVDAAGLVLDYPETFRRVFPR